MSPAISPQAKYWMRLSWSCSAWRRPTLLSLLRVL
jgi:hypothetical protein